MKIRIVTCRYCNTNREYIGAGRAPTLCESCRKTVKYCYECDKFKLVEEFCNSSYRPDKLNSRCKECSRKYAESRVEVERELAAKRRKNNPISTALNRIRARCKLKGIKFELTLDNVPEVPETCPILGIKLERFYGKSGGSWNSPSLDRIIPALGYIPGNVQWISKRANSAKLDLTKEELILLGRWAEHEMCKEIGE